MLYIFYTLNEPLQGPVKMREHSYKEKQTLQYFLDILPEPDHILPDPDPIQDGNLQYLLHTVRTVIVEFFSLFALLAHNIRKKFLWFPLSKSENIRILKFVLV